MGVVKDEKLKHYKLLTEKFKECVVSNNDVSTVCLGEAALLLAPVYEWIFGVGVISKHLQNDIIGHATIIIKEGKQSVANQTVNGLITSALQRRTIFFVCVSHGRTSDDIRKDRNCGIVNLLWTKRCVDFILRFLEYGLIQFIDETLHYCASLAYAQVLKPYHGVLLLGIVSLAFKMTPKREDFIQLLGFSELVSAQRVFKTFLESALPVVQHVHDSLERHNCNFNDKV